MSLREVADRLYAIPPAEFTSARGDEVSAAKESGDRALAAEINRLRRPSVGAWLVNTLAREAPADLDELLDLGAHLRAAQEALDGDQLRKLSQRRRRSIDGLTVQAARLAARSGARVSDAATREVAATLDAAVADEDAGHAVRSGLLVRTLISSGFDAVDLDGAVAVPDVGADRPASGRPQLRAVPGAGTRRRASSRKIDAARDAAAVAQRKLVKADTALSAAAEEVQRARDRVTEAEDELQQARAAVQGAEGRLAEAEQRHGLAEKTRNEAVAARDRARRALTDAERAEAKRADRT
jgi:hypothetical protein